MVRIEADLTSIFENSKSRPHHEQLGASATTSHAAPPGALLKNSALTPVPVSFRTCGRHFRTISRVAPARGHDGDLRATMPDIADFHRRQERPARL